MIINEIQRDLPLTKDSTLSKELLKDGTGKTVGVDLPKLKKLLRPASPTTVFATYWTFAVKRQQIFFRRFNGAPPPWTDDSILASHRFTNAYRAADRVSQYLIKKVQYNNKWNVDDLFFRTILFKFFNRIETWERLVQECGEPQWCNFSRDRYAKVLDAAMAEGRRVYSAAYIMPSGGPRSRFARKHCMHLELIEKMMRDGLPVKIASAKSMSDGFNLLRAYPTLGDFLAYQYVTDLNYSELSEFQESEFTIAGPGAHEGIRKCFSDLGGKDSGWIIRRVAEVQEDAFAAVGASFPKLWGRPLQLIDCQNLFCEVGKYARIRHPEFNELNGRVRIKQKFVANSKRIEFTFPRKWNLIISRPNHF